MGGWLISSSIKVVVRSYICMEGHNKQEKLQLPLLEFRSKRYYFPGCVVGSKTRCGLVHIRKVPFD